MGPPPKAHCAKKKIQISQVWDLIETWGFCKDIKDVRAIGLMIMTPPQTTLCKNKSSIFSALGNDRDLGFSRGHQGRQGHRPRDDEDDEEEDDKVEDNNKNDDNNKDDNNDKGISALGQQQG